MSQLLLACFSGAAFLTHALRHVVRSAMGRPLLTPFARLRDNGLSSPMTRFLWGSLSGLAASLLLIRRALPAPGDVAQATSGFVGPLVTALPLVLRRVDGDRTMVLS